MSFPSFRKLAGIAMGATVLGVSVFKLMQVDKTDEICHSPYFRKAFKELRANTAAVEFLGEPIEQEKFDSSDGYNFCDGTKARFAVNVKGSKDKGMVYFWAKHGDDGKWTIDRMELGTSKEKFMLKDGPVDLKERKCYNASS